MLRGMTTQTHYVEDVPAVIAWYSDLLDLQPYFLRPSAQEPAYAEFRIGPDEDELGFIDQRYAPEGRRADGVGVATTYWHVEDVASAMDDLVSRGATEVEPLVRREAGFVTGVVRDPFGLVLGLMHSPHWASRH